MSDPDQYSRRTVLKLSGTAAAAAVTAGAATPAAAQTSDDPNGLFGDETLSGRVWKWAAFVGGFTEGAASRLKFYEDPDANEIDRHVSAIVDEFDAHTDDWLTYVNDRGLGGTNRETLAVTFQYAGESRKRYVVAEYTDDAYQSVGVQTPEEWNQDSADIEATVSDDAVENGADELRELHDQYIVSNEDIDRSYASELAGRYYFAPNDHVSVPESLLG